MSTDTTAPGLRERTKARRRRLILLSALRLFAERGYERTTIADIAAAAEVAPRTVTGYFPSKLDFITEWPAHRSARVIELYRQHPDVDFVALVDLVWADAMAHTDREEATLTRAMSLANPGVAAMAEAEVSHRLDDPPLPPDDIQPDSTASDDLRRSAGAAAIRAVNHVFFQGIADGTMTDELRGELLDIVRSLVRSTNAGHGTLRPGA